MCRDTNLTVGKQGLSYLAVRLVPDEAVAASTASRTVPKVILATPTGEGWLVIRYCSPAG